MSDQEKTCQWTFYGLRCRFPGSLSTSTIGGGPWFCKYHVRTEDLETGKDIAEKSQQWVPVDDMDHFRREVILTLRENKLTKKADEPPKIWLDRLKSFCKTEIGKIGILKKPLENL